MSCDKYKAGQECSIDGDRCHLPSGGDCFKLTGKKKPKVKKKKTVKQIGEFDCFLACIAMVAGKSIAETFPKKFRDEIEKNKTTSGDNIDKAFGYAGLKRDVDFWSIALGMNSWSFQTRAMMRGRKVLFQVPSLNYEKGSHIIFWDGEEIHDPSNKQIYQWLHQFTPEYIWIFNGQ